MVQVVLSILKPAGNAKIYSTMTAFAAIKTDGSIKAWGELNYGGSGAPSTGGYTKIYQRALCLHNLDYPTP
jgi:hypothetical protein